MAVRITLLLGATLTLGVLAAAGTASAAATCVGACGVAAANGDVAAPPGGGNYSWISTAGGVNGAGQIPAVGGTDGSALTSAAFTANAGQTLGYDFNFVTSDGQNGRGAFVYEDYAWVELIDANSSAVVATLFTARTEPTGSIVPGAGLPGVDPGVTLTPGAVPISAGSGASGAPNWAPLQAYSGQCWGGGCGLTGWVHSDFVVQTSGAYKVVFGVSNWGDTVYDTGLAISGLNIGGTVIDDDPGAGSPAPEPAAWAFMLVGFGLAGLTLRQELARRQRAT